MKATTKTMTTTTAQEQAIDQQTAQVGMGIIVAFSGLSGIWGAACFISALAQNGIARMATEYARAVMGG